MEAEIDAAVRQCGWFALAVNDHQPPFQYTIGFTQTCDHPELIIFGLDSESAYEILAAIYKRIGMGRSFVEPGIHPVTVDNQARRIGCRPVDPTQHPLYLGFAMGYCRFRKTIGALKAVQAFWPDGDGRFPFDVGCDDEACRLQPRLDIALTASEQARFKRQWE